jgi:hypothetical protein
VSARCTLFDSEIDFLAFAPAYAALAEKLADAVSMHATPVGGAATRTECIPIHERAKSAVITWMRHQATTCNQMKIPRFKGKRRETRRLLAEKSRQLLEAYRAGKPVVEANRPLRRVLEAWSDP